MIKTHPVTITSIQVFTNLPSRQQFDFTFRFTLTTVHTYDESKNLRILSVVIMRQNEKPHNINILVVYCVELHRAAAQDISIGERRISIMPHPNEPTTQRRSLRSIQSRSTHTSSASILLIGLQITSYCHIDRWTNGRDLNIASFLPYLLSSPSQIRDKCHILIRRFHC